jgi:Flp pilus assembly pilin Flp
MSILTLIQANVKSERGASMVEYAFLVILIAVICFVAILSAGHTVSTAFSSVGDGFTTPN